MLSKFDKLSELSMFQIKRFNHLKFKSPQGRYLLFKNMHVRYRKDSKFSEVRWCHSICVGSTLSWKWWGALSTPTIFSNSHVLIEGSWKIDEFFGRHLSRTSGCRHRGSGVVRNTQEIITGVWNGFNCEGFRHKLYQIITCLLLFHVYLNPEKDMIPDLSHIFSTITVLSLRPFAKRWFTGFRITDIVGRLRCPFPFSERDTW